MSRGALNTFKWLNVFNEPNEAFQVFFKLSTADSFDVDAKGELARVK